MDTLFKDEVESLYPIAFGDSLILDFCVWTLLLDGLRVYPFSSHQEGNKELRKLGLNSQNWKAWFQNVAKSQDMRLGWKVSDHEKSIDDAISSFQITAQDLSSEVFPLDFVSIQQEIESQFLWQNEQYKNAVNSSGFSEIISNPLEVWQGNSTLKLRLEELWHSFCTNQTQSQIQHAKNHYTNEDLNNLLNEFRSEYSSRISSLQIHIVDYIASFSISIKPVSIVISCGQKNMGIKDLKSQIHEAARNLIT